MGGYGTSGIGGTGTTQAFAVSLNLNFEFQSRTPERVSQGLSALLSRTDQLRAASPMVVTLRGDTAILRGTVTTQHDRDLAEQLARLEPGVAQVENELIVGRPAATPASPSPATP